MNPSKGINCHEELNLNLAIAGSPLRSALRMFVSFLIVRLLPIQPFFVFSGFDAFFVAIGISVSTSFGVGVIKSKIANTNKIIGGLEVAGLGTGVAFIWYDIGNELTNQISLAKNTDKKIDIRKLSQLSKVLNSIILASEITEESKSMLQKFSSTLIQDKTTTRNLRYEKQDLERVLANLNDL